LSCTDHNGPVYTDPVALELDSRLLLKEVVLTVVHSWASLGRLMVSLSAGQTKYTSLNSTDRYDIGYEVGLYLPAYVFSKVRDNCNQY